MPKARTRFAVFLSLLSSSERVRFCGLIVARIALGGCDLLLAASMYWLFLLMDGASSHPMHAFLPTSVLLAAICTVGVVLTRMLLDVVSLHAVAGYMRSLNQKFLLALMQGYGDMRWNVVVQRNRSELLKHTTSTAQDAAYSYQMLIELAGESIVILLFALALIWVSPKLAVSVSCFVLCLYLVQRFFLRQRSSAAALQRDRAMLTLHRLGSEFLLLGKEIRTYRNQPFFLDRLAREAQQLGEAQVMVGFLPQVSRILVDQGTAVLFLSIIILAELRNGDVRHLFALLVYYVVISQRLLPLVSHVAWMLAQLECAITNVQTVRTELDQSALYRHPDLQTDAPPPDLILHMQNVTFSHDASASILQDVQFSMRAGELVVLHGPSGAGKTSLLNLIAGLSVPTHGSIAVCRERMAYVPQEVTLLDDSLRNNLRFGLDQLDDKALVAALDLVQLRTLLESLPQGLETRVGDNGILFSGGQRQRIGIARALLRNATLILLDEATSAMDEELERQVLTNLSAANIALLLVSHRTRNRMFADRVLHLRGGRLEPLIDNMAHQGG